MYQYDCFGRRIAKVIDADGLDTGPTETRFFYGGQAMWQVLEERDAAANTLATYVYGNYIDEPLTMQRDIDGMGGPENYFYHTDDVFNVMGVTDDTGAVVERYEYGDYGQSQFMDAAWVDVGESAIANPSLLAGQRLDSETGLHYFRTRYLDAEAGRFMMRDTIGVWADRSAFGNGFAYVGNAPWQHTDPFGRLRCFHQAGFDQCVQEMCNTFPIEEADCIDRADDTARAAMKALETRRDAMLRRCGDDWICRAAAQAWYQARRYASTGSTYKRPCEV